MKILTSGFHRTLAPACLLLASVMAGGCATDDAAERQASPTQADNDPYEHTNREIYAFNRKVDKYIAKPVADTYQEYTPQFVQTGISNFFMDMRNIDIFANDLLQAKFLDAGEDMARFLLNTTLGLAGLMDVATDAGLAQHYEDFSQTLAVWGVPQGAYLVVPFLGPLTVRGIPGAIFDTAFNPITYSGPPLLSEYLGASVQGVYLVDRRSNAAGSLKFIDEAALDPYVFTRDSFLQWRNYLAKDGKVEYSPDFLDPEDDDRDDSDTPKKP